MADNELEQYYMALDRLEANIQNMDVRKAEEILNDLFDIKPVRLKWYLLKARLMLKQGKEIEEIIAFLSEKCDPWYDYDGVEEYFDILCYLVELKGDFVESKRYRYQFQKMQEILHGINGKNMDIDNEIARISTKMKEETILQVEDMEKLAELYYISGNIYLYLLWVVVMKRIYGQEELAIRKKILEKPNVGYYYERLTNEKEETFVIMETKEDDMAACVLAKRALKLLGKKVFVFKAPVLWDKGNNIKQAVSESIAHMETENKCEVKIYYIDDGEGQQDTRSGCLDYLAENYSENDLVTVLGSGLLLDQIGLEEDVKPRFERLTQAEADYFEENVAVGRYGDYLGYIANIYMTSKDEVQRELYKESSCRFSIIIPCRNAGSTLYYTLKSCLHQDFEGTYEIVVSDNSDMSWGMNTPTYRICQEFRDERIKYYRTPRNLSLMKNFEYGYLKAQGEFLISMGADDGILPWALKELDGVIREYPDRPVWLWHEAFYKWPEVDESIMNGAGEPKLNVDIGYSEGSPKVFEYESRDVFLKSLRKYQMVYYLPQVYHNSGINRSYLGTLYEKTGVLWAGISQDICMAVTIGNIEEKLSFIDNMLTITGISNASIGANARVGNSKLQQTELEKRLNNTITLGWRVPGYIERLCPVTGGEESGLYACILYAYAIGAISNEMIRMLDWKLIYSMAVGELNLNDIMYDKKIHRLRYAASLQGEEMLEWFDSNLYSNIFPRVVDYNRPVRDEKRDSERLSVRIQGEKVDVEYDNISDVYKVSLFLKQYYHKDSH